MTGSIQEKEQRDRCLFTGRRHELEMFRRILDSRPGDPEMLCYYGIGGVGKSWLLKEIAAQMGEANIPVLMLSCDRLALPSSIRDQLRNSVQNYPGTSKDFQDFDRDWRRLETIEKEIRGLIEKTERNADEKTPGKVASPMIGAAIEVAFDILLPGPVGGALGKLLGQAGESLAEVTVDKIVPSLTKLGLRQDNAEFYANATSHLAISLVTGINSMAERTGHVVLLVDAIEFLRNQEELWLRNQIIDRLDLSRIVPIIAGRRKLDILVWRDWSGMVHQLEIQPFTQTESQNYLSKRGVSSLTDANRLHALARGLPLGLAIAAFIYTSGAPLDFSFDDTKTQIVDRLLDYFLTHVAESKRREEMLLSAVPRTITTEVLSLIFSDPTRAEDVYDWLRSLYTTQVRADGLLMHDIVRDVMVDHLRRRSPDQFHTLNQQLMAWYREKRAKQIPFSTDWQRTTLEYFYHALCVDEDRAIQEAALYFLNAQEFIGHGLIGDIITLFENCPPAHLQNQTWVKYCRAQLAFLNSQFNLAIHWLRQLYKRTDLDPYLRANVVTSLAVLTQYHGQVEDSIRLHEEGLQIRKQLNDRAGIKRSLTNVGRIYRIVRDWKKSLANLAESRQLAEEDGDQVEVGRILLNTGYIAMYQGHWVDAERDYAQALSIAQQNGDRYDSSKALMRLGQLRVWEGCPAEAVEYLHQSLADYKSTGELFGEGFVHNYLGDAWAVLKQWEKAKQELDVALSLFQLPQVNARDRVGNVRHSFGDLCMAQGDSEGARAAYLEAINIRRALKNFYFLPKSLVSLCFVELTHGTNRFDEFAQEAESYALKYEDFFQLARLRVAQGHAQLRQRETLPSVSTLYGEALTYALRFNGYAVNWVLQSVNMELQRMIMEGKQDWVQQMLVPLVETCRTTRLDNLSLDEAERLANSRVPSMVEKNPQVEATLLQWSHFRESSGEKYL